MIPRSSKVWQGPAWRKALSEAFTRPEALFEYLRLDPCLLPAAKAAAGTFRLRVPRGYARRIRQGDIEDPLLRQILPSAAELDAQPGFTQDPVGDLAAGSVPGVLHKYQGRALLISTASCAVNCRFCFRRHFPYADARAERGEWADALKFIADNPNIDEVILSGGDPLLLDDSKLAGLAARLDQIPHLLRLRVHSRIPIVLPERVCGELLAWMTRSRLTPVLVVHCNHPNELADDVLRALESIRSAGITLLNQSVLLRGVNDRAEVLSELSIKLFDAGVLPYYLHLLDRVQGAAHFDVPEQEARFIHQRLRECLPGYLVPRMVREQAGAAAKVPLR